MTSIDGVEPDGPADETTDPQTDEPGSTSTDPTSEPTQPPQQTTPPAGQPTEPPAQSEPPASTPPSAPPSTPPSSSPPPAEQGPTVVLTSMACNGSGPHQKLRVQLTADFNNKYRKGITSVTLTRHDERGTAWISPSDATWAGEYAGKGNKWSGELPSRNPSQEDYGTGNDYGKVLRLKVRTDNGKHWEFDYLIERDC